MVGLVDIKKDWNKYIKGFERSHLIWIYIYDAGSTSAKQLVFAGT